MTGAKPTVTGTSASARRDMASSRLAGVAARGSMARASFRSRVVMDTAALTRPFFAIGPIRSVSRAIRADLVMMLNGWLKRLSTSTTPRVMRSSRSTG